MDRNARMYSTMSRWLTVIFHGEPTKESLWQFASKIAAKLNIKIDRDARRLKDSLMCWICENAPQLLATEPATVPDLLPATPTQTSNGNTQELDSTDGVEFWDCGDDVLFCGE
jgi:hypothetical protein